MVLSTHTTNLPAFSQRTFSRGDLMPLNPNILLRIEQGVVRNLTWNAEGTTITLGYWSAGDVVGQPLSQIQPYHLECLTSVEVSYIPAEGWSVVLDGIIKHIQQAEELLCIIRSESVGDRLQQLLFWLARKFGRSVEHGQLIDLRLTHQEISEILGTTRVTVTRLLSQFEREGIIYRPRRHFILLRWSVAQHGCLRSMVVCGAWSKSKEQRAKSEAQSH